MHSFEGQLYKEKFQRKYRIQSARLSGYNYSANGAYFVTICTKNRRHFFGKISHKKMLYSDVGSLACSCWRLIPNHFPFVRLGEWVVMPNHVHGIIWIDKNPVETLHATSLQGERKTSYSGAHSNFSSLSPKKYSLSSIIRSYKSAVSRSVHLKGIEFAWQTRFHEHIIRNDDALYSISEYIKHNPECWAEDSYC
jgi:putative transposase